eukprot:4524598-Amphidinium_carterae.1
MTRNRVPNKLRPSPWRQYSTNRLPLWNEGDKQSTRKQPSLVEHKTSGQKLFSQPKLKLPKVSLGELSFQESEEVVAKPAKSWDVYLQELTTQQAQSTGTTPPIVVQDEWQKMPGGEDHKAHKPGPS